MAVAYPPFLDQVIRQAMQERGLRVDFSPAALAEAQGAQAFLAPGARDLTAWLWSSIDNDDSQDLDQIEYAVEEPGGIRLYVAIADVASSVASHSAIDTAAYQNTTSIYTGVEIFSMLPERLSTHMTSLLEGQKRSAMVIEMLIGAEGSIASSNVYPALVMNRAQLAYHGTALWFEVKETPATAAAPPSGVSARVLAKIDGSVELQKQLTLQNRAAEALRKRRHDAGSLSLQVGEFQPVLEDQGAIDLVTREPNVATRLIEDLMIAANQAVDNFLSDRHFPVFRRVVRTPRRWDRLVELARQRGSSLPKAPDAKALEAFLADAYRRDPGRFPDLSLAVVKLLGRGEYVVAQPGQDAPGHFALAVQHYSHSTAPNRRYPDLITQRLLHALWKNQPPTPPIDVLSSLATHCTAREDDANKVERFARKCVAALALSRRIGQTFDGFVTGAGDAGTWVRLRTPPVEGRLIGAGVDVGDAVRVRLKSTDPRRGFIDFELLGRNS